eukprot:scaffold10533_cov101-Isochrysis_galbana.AAC.4
MTEKSDTRHGREFLNLLLSRNEVRLWRSIGSGPMGARFDPRRRVAISLARVHRCRCSLGRRPAAVRGLLAGLPKRPNSLTAGSSSRPHLVIPIRSGHQFTRRPSTPGWSDARQI